MPFIIAELSANHNQDLNLAKKTIHAVARSGADAVKFQTYKPSCLTLESNLNYFKIKDGLWKDKTLWELYKEAYMPWEWHEELYALAKSLGLVAFSSPFSTEGVAFLEKLSNPIYKVASFEVGHTELLKAIAKTKKPVILSTGVCTKCELENALKIFKNHEITLLHCTSSYPATLKHSSLYKIKDLQASYPQVRVGLSDHTLGYAAPLVAMTLGASVIEKHFILDKSLGGVDSAFSMDEREFSEMVSVLKEASLALKPDPKDIKSKEEKTKVGREFARSLFIASDAKKGEVITKDHLACVRPNLGLDPLKLDSIIGKRFAKDVIKNHPLKDSDIQG
ncbi:pseudaminic acid synthase [Helicobacter sp. 11S02629-2]|uniref:pseudaminic acid synthase n=1 Tax=Helicobacter sp. 11S02629-2 TaxID=1476195 RepID=UPI000BA7DFA4|nr:pseudaminic acid synthase [Helicobacter sp. 11S02629-2]PAF44912.1 pseudaminic acid synthase [Helicobacter sp. 11S02629-2]